MINALAYPRAAAAEFDAPVAVRRRQPGDDRRRRPSLEDMIAGTERACC